MATQDPTDLIYFFLIGSLIRDKKKNNGGCRQSECLQGLNEITEDLSANNGAGGGRQANARTRSSDDPFGGRFCLCAEQQADFQEALSLPSGLSMTHKHQMVNRGTKNHSACQGLAPKKKKKRGLFLPPCKICFVFFSRRLRRLLRNNS